MNPKQQIKERESATGHSVCSPSQLYRILACPASYMEGVKAPLQSQSTYAARGTMLHDIVSRVLEGKATGKLRMEKLEVDDQNQVLDCLEYADRIIKKHPDGQVGIEIQVDLKPWGMPEIWGTSDLSVHLHSLVHVVDWKFGSGVQVYAENNEQLMAYAAGVVGYPSQVEDVLIHIVQPAINHFDQWKISYKRLSEWVFDVLQPGIDLAMSDKAEYHPGEKQCRFCPAGMTCRARHKSALRAAEDVFRVYSAIPQVTKAELDKALTKIQEMMTYAQQIQKYVEMELLHGRPFPGYKLVAGRAMRKWVDEDRALNWLKGNSAIKPSDLFKKKFISPAQAEKLDRALKKDDTFKQLIHKPPGKHQVAKEDDPRPAIEPDLEAAKAFEGYQEED